MNTKRQSDLTRMSNAERRHAKVRAAFDQLAREGYRYAVIVERLATRYDMSERTVEKIVANRMREATK